MIFFPYRDIREEPRQIERPGDWNCKRCGYHNFATRMQCMKCCEPKPSTSSGSNTGASKRGGKHIQIKRCTETIDWNGMDLIPVQREFLVEHPTVLGRSDDENKRLRINNSIEILNEGT